MNRSMVKLLAAFVAVVAMGCVNHRNVLELRVAPALGVADAEQQPVELQNVASRILDIVDRVLPSFGFTDHSRSAKETFPDAWREGSDPRKLRVYSEYSGDGPRAGRLLAVGCWVNLRTKDGLVAIILEDDDPRKEPSAFVRQIVETLVTEIRRELPSAECEVDDYGKRAHIWI